MPVASAAHQTPLPEARSLTGSATPTWLSDSALSEIEELRRLPFAGEELAGRRERAVARLRELDGDAIVVFRPSSVEYLSGFHTVETLPQPLVLTAAGESLLCVPTPELGRALVSATGVTVGYHLPVEDGLRALADWLRSSLKPGARVLLELDDGNVPSRFVTELAGRGYEVADGGFLVERLRLVLSPAELACVEAAAVHTHAGIQAAVEAARAPDATDSSVAAAATAALFRDADSATPWTTVVCTGPWGGLPHSTWSRTPIHRDEPTFVELTGTHHRYCAPSMRTIVTGAADSEARRLESLAQTMLASVLAHARPGEVARDVAARVSADLSDLRPSDIFHYTFAYPIGIAHPPHWMDGAPFYIRTDNPEPLAEGMVFHLPASFRAFGRRAVGLSQTVVLESAGPRVLTHGPSELIEI